MFIFNNCFECSPEAASVATTIVDVAPEQKGRNVMDALMAMFTTKAESPKKGLYR